MNKGKIEPEQDDHFAPMTTEELNARIDQSMEDSQKGRLIEAEELKVKIDKWD